MFRKTCNACALQVFLCRDIKFCKFSVTIVQSLTMRYQNFYLAIALISLTCCKHVREKEGKNNVDSHINVYNEMDLFRKVKIIDTFCINETKRAEKDIKKKKFVLNVSNFGPIHFYDYKKNIYIKDFQNELKKLKINTDTIPKYFSCLGGPDEHFFKLYCYDETMKQIIFKKYKYDLLDSINTIICKRFVLSNPNRIFYFTESDSQYKPIDEIADFIKYQEFNFNENVVYPMGYYRDDEKLSAINVRFLLMKNGKIKKINISTDFANPINNKYENYFKKITTDFIKKVKWKQPTFAGMVANTEIHVSFELR